MVGIWLHFLVENTLHGLLQHLLPTLHTLSPASLLYLNSKRVDYKTSIGKGMGVRHAQATLTSCALTNRIVQSKLTTVRIKEARLIAALGYNWHSLVQISMIQFLTRGMKWKTFASIPFITFIQVSRILSLASIINTSDLLTCCL